MGIKSGTNRDTNRDQNYRDTNRADTREKQKPPKSETN